MLLFLLQTVKQGLSEFAATSMDDLLAHLKAIHDSSCSQLKTSYLDYMTHHYTYGKGQHKAKGLDCFDNTFATEVLEKYCNALINLLKGRPFGRTDMDGMKSADTNDFQQIMQCLLALDDPDWRPVALIAMVKANDARKKNVQVCCVTALFASAACGARILISCVSTWLAAGVTYTSHFTAVLLSVVIGVLYQPCCPAAGSAANLSKLHAQPGTLCGAAGLAEYQEGTKHLVAQAAIWSAHQGA